LSARLPAVIKGALKYSAVRKFANPLSLGAGP